jgi:iron complex transport system permease protein
VISAGALLDRRRRALQSRALPAGRRVPASVLIPALAALVMLSVVIAAGIGAVRVGPMQIIAILLDHAGIETGIAYTRQQDAVVWAIRVPRVMLAVMVGAGLAISGAVLQGIFRNPLADPSIIGVSSGAAFGAVTAIVIGGTPFGLMTTPIAAFAGGIVTTLVVWTLSRRNGRVDTVTLILVGIALNSMIGAGMGMLNYIADDEQLRAVVFWSMGSLGGATWRNNLAVLPLVALGILVLPRKAGGLNLLVLGEREARHLGVNVDRTRLLLILVVALTTGAAVAFAGIIGFVGLIVPHLIRLVAGPDHRVLLPASALAGAALLVLTDLIARTIASPAELPIGVVTALLGAPFFLFLLLRTRWQHGVI